ncbi:MAG TPA: AglZ/HisF2 family acetamidino modification protein [Syntrophales bacterium]|nr:AglZ/HisF2 family acetamidino modification protein [Syntrophales bacterium]
MLTTRVIPCLLLKGNGFYKTTKFKKPVYLGDPVNILKIFNEKEVDEIVVLDIGSTRNRTGINYPLLKDFASECFMPLGYGGGITNIDQMKNLFQLGFEKVLVNTAAYDNPNLVTQGANAFGRQSIVVSMDVKKDFCGHYVVMIQAGSKKTGRHPVEYAREMEERGAGEILVTAIDNDGTMEGYDLKLIKLVSSAVNIPVIACGGAGNVEDFSSAVREAGASAVAAGALFVFQGPHRAVLINFPSPEELESVFATS